MTIQHKQLAQGRWFELTIMEQLANIGSEVARALSWQEKSQPQYREKALERALELLLLTIADAKNRLRLKELTRLREVLIDYFYCDNQYQSTPELWRKYFFAFNWAARAGRLLKTATTETRRRGE
jgi:hypothetical protein